MHEAIDNNEPWCLPSELIDYLSQFDDWDYITLDDIKLFFEMQKELY